MAFIASRGCRPESSDSTTPYPVISVPQSMPKTRMGLSVPQPCLYRLPNTLMGLEDRKPTPW
jgi:hypothetical protein